MPIHQDGAAKTDCSGRDRLRSSIGNLAGAATARSRPCGRRPFVPAALRSGLLLGQPLLLAGYEGLKQRDKTIPPQGAGSLASRRVTEAGQVAVLLPVV